MAAVHTLETAASDVLTASYALPDLESAVQQAVYNSIDANAKVIALTVNAASASFTIVDNGNGIDPNGLYHYVGECHASSSPSQEGNRHSRPKTYAKRGAFLYEITSLASVVEIESRVPEHWTSYRKVFEHGAVVFNARSKEIRETAGTTVAVSHLFAKLPVRSKKLFCNKRQRDRVVHNIQSFCVQMSMIWPSLSFTVRFEDEGLQPVNIAAAKTCRERFLEWFGPTLGNELQYVDFVSKLFPFSIRGYFAFVPVGSEGYVQGIQQAKTYYQFAFLDNEWILECQQVCSKVITSASLESMSAIPIFVLKVAASMEQYDDSHIDREHCTLLKDPEQFEQFLQEFVQHLSAKEVHQAQADRRSKKYSHDATNLAVRENLEHDSTEESIPGFSQYAATTASILQSDTSILSNYVPLDDEMSYCGDEFTAVIPDNDGSSCGGYDSKEVDYLVEKTCWGGTFGDNFYPIQQHTSCSTCEACGHVNDCMYASSRNLESEFSSAERNDHRFDIKNYFISGENCYEYAVAEYSHQLRTKKDDSILSDIFFRGEYPLVAMPSEARATPEIEMPWLSSKPDSCVGIHACGMSREHPFLTGLPSANDHVSKSNQDENAELESGSEDDGDKLTFSVSVEKTKSCFFGVDTAHQVAKLTSRRSKPPSFQSLAAALRIDNVQGLNSLREIKISKEMLANLRVISQVDRKFILVQAAASEATILFCIDQHAADERVRLEKLEVGMFGVDGCQRNVEVHEHNPPLQLRVNAMERKSLNACKEFIESWGFEFESTSSDTIGLLIDERKSDQDRVLLYTTPKVEKRIADADDFREFIQLLASSDECVPRLYIRPPVITRFLHSRACRSAIMFGDWLSIGQCKELIEELKTCQLPFQCAHGRPSIVPLAELTYKKTNN